APLDLAVGDAPSGEMQHLSPVYEARSPSPVVTRKFELPTTNGLPSPSTTSSSGRTVVPPAPKTGGQKACGEAAPKKTEPAVTHNPRVNGIGGHAPRVRSDGDGGGGGGGGQGGWQKAKHRKRGADSKVTAHVFPQSEQPPAKAEERKGG